MKNKLRKNWPAIQLSIVHWWVFATISLIVACFFLMREMKSLQQDKAEMRQEIQTMRHNFELVEQQMGSGRVILELGK